MPALRGWGPGEYAVSQTTVLHMKKLNQTESSVFVILCVLCFQRQSFLLVLTSGFDRPSCRSVFRPLYLDRMTAI